MTNNEIIKFLEMKAKDVIAKELKFDYLHDEENGQQIVFASMPLILETRTNYFKDETSLEEMHNYIREKVYNYFYAQIFDTMKAMKTKNESHLNGGNEEKTNNLILANHNAHATLLEIIRISVIDPVNKAHIVNEIFYNYFTLNVSILNQEIHSCDELQSLFMKFEERIEKKIGE